MTQMTHSVLKLRDNTNKAPEQGTEVGLVQKLEYIPEGNLEEKDDLTSLVSHENIHANEPASGLSGSNENTCTDVEKMQLNIDHPSEKTSLWNNNH